MTSGELTAQGVLAKAAAEVEIQLDRHLRPAAAEPAIIHEAMRFAVLSPGKRLRPALCLEIADAVGGPEGRVRALPVAAALEMVHAFSLIHDDLPAMDDDVLRRGRPTCHVKFGEAAAILAGDALEALAFEVIARHVLDAALARDCLLELARAVGTGGMIGGQHLDLISEGEAPRLETVQRIHLLKTASLMAAACSLGARCGGAMGESLLEWTKFGHHLGLAFQIKDDLLDAQSSEAKLGKPVRRDAVRGKQTWPAATSVEQAQQQATEEVMASIALLMGKDPKGHLGLLARYCAERER